MGRISQVIYSAVDCSREEATKSYWYQNILNIDHTIFNEYEKYERSMKDVLNNTIVKVKGVLPPQLCPLVDTTIMGASIKGGVTLATEIR